MFSWKRATHGKKKLGDVSRQQNQIKIGIFFIKDMA